VAEVLVTLEDSAARWAKGSLEEKARELRAEAQKARVYGSGHTPAKMASIYVANAIERAANELLRAQAGIKS
jgi:hypothetical protein